MRCRVFQGKIELLLPSGGPLPPQFAAHAARCPRCAADWQTALRSQILLAGLREDAAEDGTFYLRLRARIEQQSAKVARVPSRARRLLAAARLKPARV